MKFTALLTGTAYAATWSYDQTMISFDLAKTAYCGYQKYESHVFTGAAKGFVTTHVIYDDQYDVEGYIGYLASDNSIYVTFRGTDSDRNMFVDGQVNKVPYTMWPECGDCNVHAGFQMAYLKTADQVLAEV